MPLDGDGVKPGDGEARGEPHNFSFDDIVEPGAAAVVLPFGRAAAEGRAYGRAEGALAQVRAVFRQWFGGTYDLDACDAVCAVVASERLSGDPVWLLVISGAGAAKTETVQAAAGAGAVVISTIASEGALLSATKARGKVTGTGGLLRKIGQRGCS